MSYDISFCSNTECKREDCRRHLKNTPKEGLYSMCTFNEKENTDECDWYWKLPVKEGGRKK